MGAWILQDIKEKINRMITEKQKDIPSSYNLGYRDALEDLKEDLK